MENEAFDDALRSWVAAEELPAATADWQRMAARLDRHDGLEAAPPVTTRKRAYIWLLPLAAAAVLCAVIFRTAFYKEGVTPAPTVASAPQTQSAARDQPMTHPPGKEPALTTIPRGKAPNTASHPTAQSRPPLLPGKLFVTPPATLDTAAFIAKTDRPEPVAKEKVAPKQERPQSYAGPDAAPRTDGRNRAALGVFGGYNIGQAKNDFTLGLALSKKLGGRLRLETNVAVVSGSYNSYRGSQQTYTAPPGTALGNTVAYMYEPAPQQLLYLQASPSLSYELYHGLSAGGGLDAQRLLSASSAAQLTNSAGNKEAPQPDWDLGLTGRVDYQVAKKLRAGFVYRNSVYGRSYNGGDAARRNYLLVQVGYRLF